MIDKPTADEAEAIAILTKRSPNPTALVVGWLKRSLSKTDAIIRSERRDVELRQSQGEGMALEQILKHFPGADL